MSWHFNICITATEVFPSKNLVLIYAHEDESNLASFLSMK